MFNGVLERYTWKIVGKKELYIPYDSNKIAGNKVKYKDLVRPRHLNQDLPRYELHRVWVVQANLLPGTSRTVRTRSLEVDEDVGTVDAGDDNEHQVTLYI